jgi:hypothetical protein
LLISNHFNIIFPNPIRLALFSIPPTTRQPTNLPVSNFWNWLTIRTCWWRGGHYFLEVWCVYIMTMKVSSTLFLGLNLRNRPGVSNIYPHQPKLIPFQTIKHRFFPISPSRHPYYVICHHFHASFMSYGSNNWWHVTFIKKGQYGFLIWGLKLYWLLKFTDNCIIVIRQPTPHKKISCRFCLSPIWVKSVLTASPLRIFVTPSHKSTQRITICISNISWNIYFMKKLTWNTSI